MLHKLAQNSGRIHPNTLETPWRRSIRQLPDKASRQLPRNYRTIAKENHR